MGMDVYGSSGNYFRNSVWSWKPLADYIQYVAPEIASHCDHWHSNDGDGLNKEDSLALAGILQSEIDSGRCRKYQLAYDERLAALPDEICALCEGTGIRSDKVGVEYGQNTKVLSSDHPTRPGQMGWCNGCDGTGTKRPFDTYYPFEVENVQEFVEFLRGCDGFEIH